MSHHPTLHVADMLLISALHVERDRGAPFTGEDLVVAAWREFPHVFGLSGHLDDDGKPLYPDSNRVYAETMGSKPVRKRGLLEKTGKKMYRLTEAGREVARELERALEGQSRTEGRLTEVRIARDTEGQLLRLRRSRAVTKIETGRREDLSFSDACIFWRITPHSYAIELEGKLSEINSLISSAREHLTEGATRLGRGQGGISLADVRLVEETHKELQLRFESQLDIMRNRTDQRKH